MVWSLRTTQNIASSIEGDFRDGLETYRSGSRDMLRFFYATLAATSLTFLMGIAAIFSRWGSFLASLSAAAAAVAYCGTTALCAGLAAIMQETMNKELEEPNNIRTHYGNSVIYVNGLGCIVSVAATFFWFLSVFCFSGRSPYNERDRRERGRIAIEKAPYTYEKLPYSDQGSSNQPLIQRCEASQPATSVAYEPFRHSGAANA